MTYWHPNTDWGVRPRYFIARLAGGKWVVEDGDTDVGTSPVAEYDSRAAALAHCRQLNGR